MRLDRTRDEGFTLVEVMVALVIFLIGILGVAGLLATVTRSNRGATNRTRADQVLYQKIEELMSTPYAAVISGVDQDTVGNVVFTSQWTVLQNDPVPNSVTIDLAARWTERGETFTVRQATIKSAN